MDISIEDRGDERKNEYFSLGMEMISLRKIERKPGTSVC